MALVISSMTHHGGPDKNNLKIVSCGITRQAPGYAGQNAAEAHPIFLKIAAQGTNTTSYRKISKYPRCNEISDGVSM